MKTFYNFLRENENFKLTRINWRHTFSLYFVRKGFNFSCNIDNGITDRKNILFFKTFYGGMMYGNGQIYITDRKVVSK